MRKTLKKYRFHQSLIALSLAGVLLLPSSIAYMQAVPTDRAETPDDTVEVQPDTTVNDADDQPVDSRSPQTISDEPRELTCEDREEHVRTLMEQQSERIGAYSELFATIAERTEVFAEASGLDAESYEEEATAVEEQETEMVELLSQLEAGAEDFDCDDSDPGLLVETFVTDHQESRDVLSTFKEVTLGLVRAVQTELLEAADEAPAGVEDDAGEEPAEETTDESEIF